jgi:hypothetical protein
MTFETVKDNDGVLVIARGHVLRLVAPDKKKESTADSVPVAHCKRCGLVFKQGPAGAIMIQQFEGDRLFWVNLHDITWECQAEATLQQCLEAHGVTLTDATITETPGGSFPNRPWFKVPWVLSNSGLSCDAGPARIRMEPGGSEAQRAATMRLICVSPLFYETIVKLLDARAKFPREPGHIPHQIDAAIAALDVLARIADQGQTD